ncbi:adenosine kinase [Saccharicrinis fermentans]|uniref:Putative sugar kinase YdjH n=1 Tax=Saccharicrinis fermentans DSM 9555 = JCM 21142 TaxID=869213 RepID=W7Y848_9BACT|nr:adenosine kinase [Saccharicrinis fermentans]GAF04437.1 putative sugar kinase YdjH [Saccharicrinis fermentans DSM 9555 = JCM 21142]
MSKVLGMGNALVDILARIEHDDLLEKLNLPKGSMQLVDADTSSKVLDEIANYTKEQASGGSAANTIHGLSCLAVSTGFFGKVGRDELGAFFKKDMSENNIEPQLLESDSSSGKAVALISPDSERTFATYLGAAVELCAEDVCDALFKGYSHFHIEGYLVYNQPLIEKALKCAKEANLIVSLDLASFNVVEDNLTFLKDMVAKYVDIHFANEEEAKAFTNKTHQEALDEMAKDCNIAVLKLGKNGSLIKQAETTFEVGVIPAKSIDTTGAGDLYAAGFLYGLVNLMPLDKCGEIGALLSGNVIEVVGPKMDDERWKKIHSELKKLKN